VDEDIDTVSMVCTIKRELEGLNKITSRSDERHTWAVTLNKLEGMVVGLELAGAL